MAVNWGLAQQPNALAMMLQGFEAGRQERKQEASRNALNALLMGGQTPGIGDGIPGNKRMDGSTVPYADLQPEDMRTALVIQGQQREQAAAQEQQGFDGLAKVSNLLKGVRDEASYQQARQIAAQNGINLSRVPQTYDPNWVQGQLQFIEAMKDPAKQQALSTYGKIAMDRGLQPGTQEFGDFVAKAYELDQIKTIATQPGGGVAQFNPVTNRTEMVIAPNTGGYAAGTPVRSAPVQKSVGGKTYEKRGDQWFELGGASSNASGGFRP